MTARAYFQLLEMFFASQIGEELAFSYRGSLSVNHWLLSFSFCLTGASALAPSPSASLLSVLRGLPPHQQLCAENMGSSSPRQKGSFMLSTKMLFEKQVLMLFDRHYVPHPFTSHVMH
ncbi:hypothetical protein CHARACLAT_026223 [Characodon lateralis]|uniref:Uncharacterized protein n=1 Tax=Characodon lateralis TaxID=208331 RepID=A0ABU7EN16_9TELE|nr:hypothetical protein [Characodon lateralis]